MAREGGLHLAMGCGVSEGPPVDFEPSDCRIVTRDVISSSRKTPSALDVRCDRVFPHRQTRLAPATALETGPPGRGNTVDLCNIVCKEELCYNQGYVL